MRLRCALILLVASLMAAAAVAQDVSRTWSGPFWDHIVVPGNSNQECSVTVNGQAVNGTAQPEVAVTTTPSIPFAVNCNSRGNTATFTGQIKLSVPTQTPILPTCGFFVAPLPPTPPPSATMTGTYTLNFTGTVAGVNVFLNHGRKRSSDGINTDFCASTIDRKSALTPGSSTPENIYVSCPN